MENATPKRMIHHRAFLIADAIYKLHRPFFQADRKKYEEDGKKVVPDVAHKQDT
jgi:hypothetical protein